MANLIEALVGSLPHAQIQVIGTIKFGSFIITLQTAKETINFMLYCIVECLAEGKFGEFSESSVIHQTKTIQFSSYN